MLVVTDTKTGQTGKLVKEGGYVITGGSYINPSWRVVWDEDDVDEEE